MDSHWVLQRDPVSTPTAILETNRDITARKWAEMERTAVLVAEREYSRRLAELTKLKDDFTVMVAHELASSIAAIQTWSALLATEDLTDRQRAEAVIQIRSQADALAKLTADAQSIPTVECDGFAIHPLPTL